MPTLLWVCGLPGLPIDMEESISVGTQIWFCLVEHMVHRISDASPLMRLRLDSDVYTLPD